MLISRVFFSLLVACVFLSSLVCSIEQNGAHACAARLARMSGSSLEDSTTRKRGQIGEGQEGAFPEKKSNTVASPSLSAASTPSKAAAPKESAAWPAAKGKSTDDKEVAGAKSPGDLHSREDKQDKQQLFKRAKEYGIVPDVVKDVSPTVYDYFEVGFKATDPSRPLNYVKMGTEMAPTQVRDAPTVWWPAQGSAPLHTIIMVDPDAPSRDTPKMRHWLHWLLVDVAAPRDSNQKGLDMCIFDPKEKHKGTVEVASYKGSTPPKGTGFHRYVVLIYEQTRSLAGEAGLAPHALESTRGGFNLTDFCALHGLGHTKGIRFFLAKN